MGSGDRTTATNDAPFGEPLPGERVLWEGRPGAKPRPPNNGVVVFAFYALAPVVWLLWLPRLAHGGELSSLRWASALVIAVGAVQWVSSLIGIYRNRSRSSVVRYRLTSDRLLVARGEGDRTIAESWWVRDLREPKLVERSKKDGRDLVVQSTAEGRAGTIRLEALREATAVRELLITGIVEAANGPRREGPETTPSEELPPDVALQPGERLLWTARPQPAWWYGESDRSTSAFGALVITVVVVLAVSTPVLPVPVIVIGAVFGGYFLVGHLLVTRARARRTLYGLTTHRLLAVRSGRPTSTVQQLPLAELRPPRVRDGLLVLEATDSSKQRRSGASWMWPFESWSYGAQRVVNVATLAGLPDPDAAARLIAQAQRAG